VSAFIKYVKSDPVFSESFTAQLTKVIIRLLDEYNLSEGEVGVVIADDFMLQRLNREYGHKDAPTDVLSFSYIEPPDPDMLKEKEFAVGDIYISVDRAREQAGRVGHSLQREIILLTVHGILHILGFDHNEEADAKLMKEQEEIVMERYDRDTDGRGING